MIPDLSRFANWHAQLWDYCLSHRRLVIRFAAPEHSVDKPHGPMQYLDLCSKIAAPTYWRLQQPRCVHRVGTGEFGAREDGLAFVDEDVEITCEVATVLDRFIPLPRS